MPQPIILLEDEPISSVLCSWAYWMALMVIFMMVLIYYSNYFARERFITNELGSKQIVDASLKRN